MIRLKPTYIFKYQIDVKNAMDHTLRSALTAEQDSEYIQAIELYERILEIMPSHYTALLNLGALYFECYDFGFMSAHNIPHAVWEVSLTRSIECFSKAIEFYPDSGECFFWRGYVEYINLDYTEEVANFICKAQHKDYAYACILAPHTENDTEIIEDCLLTAIRQQFDNPNFHYEYFRFLNSHQKPDLARKELYLAIAYYNNKQLVPSTVRQKYIHSVFHTINVPIATLKAEYANYSPNNK